MSDYPDALIVIGYFVQNQDVGTSATRRQFSNDLFGLYNARIIQFSNGVQPPLDLSPSMRATIALMAANSEGGDPDEQAQEAVAQYVSFRGV
jgi:hypothetical protein